MKIYNIFLSQDVALPLARVMRLIVLVKLFHSSHTVNLFLRSFFVGVVGFRALP